MTDRQTDADQWRWLALALLIAGLVVGFFAGRVSMEPPGVSVEDRFDP